MDFIFFVGGIVFIFLIINLFGRVGKLEEMMKSRGVNTSSQQFVLQQPLGKLSQESMAFGKVVEYIKQQSWQGINREEITNSLITNGWQISDIKKAFVFFTQSTQPSSTEDVQSGGFIKWLQEDWMLKLGALLFLIGFGWLANYAFLNNWIGPVGRISIGVGSGIILIVLGYWRIKNYTNQGGIFLALGSTTILLTVFAAQIIYTMFDPLAALALMFISVVFVAVASVIYRSESLALLSLILASIAPLLTNAPKTDHIGLFTYLLMVVLGAIWIVFLTGQRNLTLAALIIIAVYSLPHFASSGSYPMETLILFAYVFAALFFFTNTAGILKSKDGKITTDLITAAGNGLFLLFWIMGAAPKEWQSLIIVVWMIIFTIGAFLIFKATQKKEPFYIYAGISFAMLVAATSIQLQGAMFVIVYAIESGLVPFIVYCILDDIKIAKQTSFLLIGPAYLSFGSIFSSSWNTSVLHKDFFVLFVMGAILLALGSFFLHSAKETNTEEFGKTFVFGSLYAYILLWLALHAGLDDKSIATMISLVIYTTIGISTYFLGLSNNKASLRGYGGILVGFVVLRLLFIDVWAMDLTGRIITFFIIGTLLIITAFLGKKSRDQEINKTIHI